MPIDSAKEVKEMLARMTGLAVDEIKEDAHLFNDIGIDSLKVIEIATYMEKTYKVTVKESQMATVKTVQDAINLLSGLTGNING